MEAFEELTEHVLPDRQENSFRGVTLVDASSANLFNEVDPVKQSDDNSNNVVVVKQRIGQGRIQADEQSIIFQRRDCKQVVLDTDFCRAGSDEDNEADDGHAGSDRLTDSNSSEKMSPPYETSDVPDTVSSIETNESSFGEIKDSIPINFPIKGRILARLRLHGKGYEYFMTKMKLVIGRNSSKGAVDIDIGHSSFISRNHLTIVYDCGDFYLSCGGKNGVFVDDVFQKIGAPRLLLPKSCALRFPSTQIVIIFDAAERFIDQYSTTNPKSVSSYEVTGTAKTLNTLSVQIPENDRVGDLKKPTKTFFSPCPSPSGTMSAVNSCPTSPTSAVVYSRSACSTSHRPIKPKYITDAVVAKDDRIPLFEGDESKPPYSYAQLIVQAISSTEDKQMTLSGIYGYIARNYSYFKGNERGWQNSIRHNLSLNRYFIKISRSIDEPGKGCFWSIDPISEPKLVAQAFRRRNKRGIPFFRGTPKTLKTQSAPVSPTPIILHPAIYASTISTNTAPINNVYSTAAGTTTCNTNAPSVVTIATVNSIAEAVTMQLKKSQVVDLNNIRSIQSAPGSPQAYKVVSAASLIAANVVPKGATSLIGSKTSGITLLQPAPKHTSVVSHIENEQISIATLTSPQTHLVQSGTLLSSTSSTVYTVQSPAEPSAVVCSVHQAGQVESTNKTVAQPIFIQLAPGGLQAQLIQPNGGPAKMAKVDIS